MHILDQPIRVIHEALLAKEVTPLDLAKEALRRAKRNTDNVFELVLEEEALSFASALSEPEPENLLWGIPYVAKDNFSTKGIVTTGSSNILNGYRPVFDATAIAKLKARKAVLIGKTTLDELAMGGTGTTGHLGPTFNPYDPSHERIVGGSSCGSASAMAAGIVPFALGSDTGDSVRRPASFAGLIGFKPTWGRISRYGLFPFAPSLDHVGFFTRYAEDAAIVLEALSGVDPNDLTSSSFPVEPYLETSKYPLSATKIVVLSDIVDAVADQKIRTSFANALTALEEKGAKVKRIAFGKELLQSMYATYIVLSCAEATSNDANLDGIKFGPYPGGTTYVDVMKTARSNGFSTLIKRRFVLGSFALMAENQKDLFLRAGKNRARLAARTHEVLVDADIICVPTTPHIAPRFDETSDLLSEEYLIADNHLKLGNFAGLPSVSMPLGYKEGMPFGVTFMAEAFMETKLLSLCRAFETITGLGGAYHGNEGDHHGL